MTALNILERLTLIFLAVYAGGSYSQRCRRGELILAIGGQTGQTSQPSQQRC